MFEGFSYNDFVKTTEDNKLILEGTPIVFNQPSRLVEVEGQKFQEVILEEALDNVDLSEVVALINHNEDRPIASTFTNTLEITKDSYGVHVKIYLDESLDKDVYDRVILGLFKDMSFGFFISDSEYITEGDTTTRYIKGISQILEVSICAIGAYSDTVIVARNNKENILDSVNKYNIEKEKEKLNLKYKLYKI